MTGRILKALCYVTRRRGTSDEILVHEHRDAPEAGLQVPAGTVEPGEAVEAAATRELLEESGLGRLTLVGTIDRYEWRHPVFGKLHHRHVFHFVAGDDVPERWDHTITGAGDDVGMVFSYPWLPLGKAAAKLAGDQGRSISLLAVEAEDDQSPGVQR